MKLNKLFSFLGSAAMLVAAVACSDTKDYVPAPEYTGDDVYFSSDQASDIDIPNGASEIFIEINRVKADDELTVGLTGSVVGPEGEDLSDIFNVPTQVTFAAGQNTAQIPVGLVFTALTAETQYVLNLGINGELTSPYGASEAQFILSFQPWGEFKRLGGDELAHVTLSLFSVTDQECAVYAAESTIEGDNRVKYQFGDYDCPELNDDASTWTWYVNGYNATVILDRDAERAVFEPMETGDEESFGSMVCVTDVYTFRTQINQSLWPGNTDEELYDLASAYNPETGRIAVMLMYYYGTTPIQYAVEYLQLPGFKSYSIDFTLLGHFISEPEKQESVRIEVYKSDDVASYALRFVEGEPTEDELAAIYTEMRADTEATLYTTSVEMFEYYLRNEGTYTMVTIGYDSNGNEVLTKDWSFTYSPIQPYPWKSVGYAEYTDAFISGIASVPPTSWDVELEQNTEDPGIIRLVNPYRAGNGWAYASDEYDLKGNYYLMLNIADPEQVYIYDCNLGINISGLGKGDIHGYSMAGYFLDLGRRPAQVARLGYFGTLKDDAITFPGSTLYVGFAQELNEDGGINWLQTNYAPDVDTDDGAAQLAAEGDFYLDLSGVDLTGAQSRATVKGVKRNITGTRVTGKSLLRPAKMGNTIFAK